MHDLTFYIHYIIHEMWKRRWAMLAIAYLIALGGIALVMSLPDTYTARSVIVVDTQSLLTRVLNQRARLLDPTTQVEQVRRLMYTDTNMRDLIRRSDLDLTVKNEADLERLVENLKTDVRLQPDNENTYSVSYTHTDPEIARQVVSNLVDLFRERNFERVSEGSEESIEFLQRTLSKVETRLASVEQELADFQRETGGDFSPLTILSTRREAATSELRQLEIEARSLRTRLDSTRAQLSGTPEQIATGYIPGVAGTRGGGQLAALRRERAQLLTRVTEAHPDVRAIDAQIEALRNSGGGRAGGTAGTPGQRLYSPNPLFTQLKAQVEQLTIDIEINKARQDQLRTRLDALDERFSRQPEILQRFNTLTAERKRLVNEADELRSDIERADLTTRVSRETAQELEVVEVATAPRLPSGPPRGLLLFMTAVLAAGAAAAISFLRIQMSDNMPTLLHLRSAFDLPILGSISQIHPAGHRRSQAIDFISFAAATGLLLAIIFLSYYLLSHIGWRPDLSALKS
ncbi:MAG: Wzz/FepE/Etk N-terminal domain-containing protein [Neomegalonema sp.]|nr:Wzz/FepE/Etk N-terminal domain-containing protein [Neomegalonema sp.]